MTEQEFADENSRATKAFAEAFHALRVSHAKRREAATPDIEDVDYALSEIRRRCDILERHQSEQT